MAMFKHNEDKGIYELEQLYEALHNVYIDFLNERNPSSLEKDLDRVLKKYNRSEHQDWIFTLMVDSSFPSQSIFERRLIIKTLSE